MGEAIVTKIARPRASVAERLALVAIGLFAGLILALAARATPDPRGYGTHASSLGLPPCGLIRYAGVPCPSCGMTTAFAHAVRGEMGRSARAQPLGFVLALATAATAVIAPALGAAGIPVLGRIDRSPHGRTFAIAFLGAILAAWAYKIAVTRGGA